MEFELWFLIVIPIMFIAGWWFRGVDQRQRDRERESTKYFQGINLFLNDEPDKAIDSFIEVASLDPHTIELHHALGNLFCRRGEFDRAVRIHTYLCNREDLPKQERSLALFELGNDFLKAGLYDRAEDSFGLLLNEPDYHLEAMRSLLRIYCTEKEWHKAIEMADRLGKEAGENHQTEVAHFYCELADQAIKAKDIAEASRYLKEALKVDRRSVRAMIASGDVEMMSGNTEDALSYWSKVEMISSDYLLLVLARMAQAYETQGRHDLAKALVSRALSELPGDETLAIAVDLLAKTEGEAEAEKLLIEQLQTRPSLQAFEMLSRLRLQENPDDAELKLLVQLLKPQVGRSGRYQCKQCGFQTKTHQWSCPGCSSWGSYPPKRSQLR